MNDWVIPEAVQRSLGEGARNLGDGVAVLKSLVNLLLGIPYAGVDAYQWCVATFIWVMAAIAFAYAQRMMMLLFGVWRPRI